MILKNVEWQKHPDTLELDGNQIDLWRIDLDKERHNTQKLLSYLSDSELDKAGRIPEGINKDRFIVSRGILRQLLSSYLHYDPSAIPLGSNKHGKPEIARDKLSTPVEFNTSHSGNLILIAVTRNTEVGVDIESLREVKRLDKIIDRYYTQAERSFVSSCASEKKNDAFFYIWTSKEAVIKARGLGVSSRLRDFDVLDHLDPESLQDPEAVNNYVSSSNNKEWKIYNLVPAKNYIAALSYSGQHKEIKYWWLVNQ